MFNKILMLFSLLIIIPNLTHAANMDGLQIYSWADRVEEVTEELRQAYAEWHENTEENVTLVLDAFKHLDRYDKLGPYGYLFKPEGSQENIDDLKWSHLSSHLKKITKSLTLLKEDRKEFAFVDRDITHIKNVLLSTEFPFSTKNALLREFCRIKLHRFFLGIVDEQKDFARLKKAHQEQLDWRNLISRVYPVIPILRFRFEADALKPLYLRFPPILHQKVVFNDFHVKTLLTTLRLLHELFVPGQDGGPSSLFDNAFRFTIKEQEKERQYEFDLGAWKEYVEADIEPELTPQLLEPRAWHNIDDESYLTVVEAQQEHLASLFVDVKNLNNEMAKELAKIIARAQKKRGLKVIPKVQVGQAETPDDLDKILKPFCDEAPIAKANASKAHKKRKQRKKSVSAVHIVPEANEFLQPSKSQAKAAARDKKALELKRLADEVGQAQMPDEDEAKEEIQKPRKTNRADRMTRQRKTNEERARDAAEREKKISQYVRQFDNFADLPPLRRDAQEFFEHLYHKETRLIDFDDFVKFSKHAGLNISSHAGGSIRIFSWTDEKTGLEIKKRFDAPHLKNNNERKYSSFIIGIARDFFSVIRATSRQRIQGVRPEADQKHFISNLRRFVQE